jgi:hypothetical protein
MTTRSILAALAIVAAVASGTAGSAEKAAPAAPLADDVKARLLQPVPGKAVVFVLRSFDDFWAWHVAVRLDARDMGRTTSNTYLRWELEPGRHTIVSETTPPAVLQLDTVPGGIYFIWQDVNPGFLRPQSRLQPVDRTTAQLVLTSATATQQKAP